jgi:hypothetical protein
MKHQTQAFGNNHPKPAGLPRTVIVVYVGALTLLLIIWASRFRQPEAAAPAQPEATATPGTAAAAQGPAAAARVSASGVSGPARQPAAAPAVQPPATGKPPQDWGIEIAGVYPSVGGRVLDVRYKVLDAAKAALLPNESGRIFLIDEANGAAIALPNSPKTGSIPQNPQKLEVGRSYSLGFPNPEGRFKSGSKVTVVIGSLRAEHLAVK